MTDNSRMKANTSPITDNPGAGIYADIGQKDFFPPQSEPYRAPVENDNVASLLRDIRELVNTPDRVNDIDIYSVMIPQNVNVAFVTNRNRVSISLYNDSAFTVYIMLHDEQTIIHGMPIPPKAEREFGSSKGFWVRCEDGDALVRYQDERLPY